MMYKRPQLEELEAVTLAPYAQKSARSKGRVYPEAESDTRTAYGRDRDRIIHTTAFRRLEYKTQVFVYYEGDHYRTRLTHTLEVSQLGRSLARGLGVNQDLTEAICLAHDLGHPPFGHAGEHALNALLQGRGGFNHNTQSYRIVTSLERRYPDFDGLNLTYETREGMIKHETDYDKSDAGDYEPDRRGSLEAQIANLADEIAYNAHDLDDGLRAGLFDLAALDELELWHELKAVVGWQTWEPFTALVRHEIIRELIGMSVTNVLEQTAVNLRHHQIDSPDKVQLHPANLVAYTPDFGLKVKHLKQFLLDNMYRHYRLVRMQSKAERFITQLFEAYIKEPKMLPTDTQQKLEQADLYRIVADYIAGMTDRYALDEWQKLFDPYGRA
ncbi:MAG: deoxyguanosinetriphosphate triphosphohydrolase [Chloroflexi bacterium]|nr:deoxyguanosinetriphosphate triphosphohydrolase [Ardenticatenaceae bacterium]MBL1127589.1 deoxyguanosinetriphosphate triphosphohydrolase [Chloroflexota bacterium]NOG33654.1 deoxyguanosinetriphosphate triphosphohydrolase [Chloroflexota bacterium]GIK56612.1 MAG: deoxyguanosinetriphosphate triphosphohydrolase-like protein [Chloroflexota bacterium]